MARPRIRLAHENWCVFIDRVIAPYFATNCWLIASEAHGECVIVDPGIAEPNLVAPIKAKLAEHRLKAVAVIITHGHLDHTFSVAPLQDDVGISSIFIHRNDRDLLANPKLAMGPQGLALFAQLSGELGGSLREPTGVLELAESQQLQIAGITMDFMATPGHTPGSITVVMNDEVVVTGDTLFAGSIGRTDLPRGSISDMQMTLREKIATLPGHLQVLPGHGEETRMEHELSSNPYLLAALRGELA